MSIIVTGGAGFIGTNFVRNWLLNNNELLVNLDKLTYAGNLKNIADIDGDKNHLFIQGDIADQALIENLLIEHNPRAIINFAAESHVDRSISNPEGFIETNIVGTFKLLEASKNYWKSLKDQFKDDFRFIHVSTDEVYGSLGDNDQAFTETNRYEPNSPYSASKAASDHLVRAYNQTYSLPTIISNCSNNYGPFQYPEKLIPLMIQRALSKKELPIYGDGLQIRDWLFVTDHCNAIRYLLENGRIGESYNVGGLNEKTNIEIVETICDILDELRPLEANGDLSSYRNLITYVQDRPGHDRRYAVNADKIRKELNWRPKESFETGIKKTINWYLSNEQWASSIASSHS